MCAFPAASPPLLGSSHRGSGDGFARTKTECCAPLVSACPARGERHQCFADICAGSCGGRGSAVRARGVPAEPEMKAEAGQALGRAHGAPGLRV